MKICVKCSVEKCLNEFHIHKSQGVQSYCKECLIKINKLYRMQNKERIAKQRSIRDKKKMELNPNFYKEQYDRFGNNSEKNRRASVDGRVSMMLGSIKNRAKRQGRSYDLDKTWLLDRFEQQGNKCCLTGIEFNLTPIRNEQGKCLMNPFGPSLDRIDCSKGYTKDNVRLVCTCVNLALSNFGTEILVKMCLGFINTLRLS